MAPMAGTALSGLTEATKQHAITQQLNALLNQKSTVMTPKSEPINLT